MAHPWRTHPKLLGRFHSDAPDDLQVLVHDGGPRLTDRSPELVWVTVTGCDHGDVFIGRILNEPQQLQSVAQGSEIKFVAPCGQYLLMVTEKYLAERPNWNIEPCNRCGLDELLDAPSDLMRATFPDLPEDASMSMFTAFCGICGGVQAVEALDAGTAPDASAASSRRKWWQFWK